MKLLEPKSIFNKAIIGISIDSNRAVYDFDLLISALMSSDKCTEDEAIEHIYHNILGSIVEVFDAPIIINKHLDDYDLEKDDNA